MPVITMELGKVSIEQKRELVTKVTELTAGVTGVPKEAFIVLIKENDAESTGFGGELLSDKRAKMAAEKKVGGNYE
ncbi:tautomerase family protein [Fusobacterium simiae]|uniref:Tautomerase family protein n=1 Tax=Fusobacterium simiae TaxID=855 RepID=A0ABT4DKM6_FUSSI|nr:4-oxalocrotonate tautomerase DmpI [Fusobacterium simiae]MCY7009165.1 tautomerase family protein [Fusobacterium simiae]